jgi:hypothetical protein
MGQWDSYLGGGGWCVMNVDKREYII